MIVYILLTTAGADTGPFNLYSDVDGFTTPFETNIDKGTLVSGYTSTLVPNGTGIIQIRSVSTLCNNYINILITTTTTTTAIDCSCTDYTLSNASEVDAAYINYTLCDGTRILAEEVPPLEITTHCCRTGSVSVVVGECIIIGAEPCGSWCD
jgi:hypothetical protein